MALVRRRLVRPDRAAPPGDDGFRFEHVLIRDAAYASIPKARRADTHERLARWLDTRPNAQDEVVGFHLEQACRWSGDRIEENWLGREAATRLGEAAHRMIERLETAAAAQLLRRAVSLLPGDDEQRRTLEIEFGYALKNEGALAESIAVLSSVEERARELGDRRLELRASVELALPRLVSGGISVAAVRSLADEALPYFEGEGDYFAAGRAARMRANADDMSMQYGSAEEHTVRAATYLRRAGHRVYFGVGTPAPFWLVGPTPVSVALDRIALALADPECSPAARGYLQTYLGELQAMRGCIDQARAHIRQAESSLREFAQSFALTTVWPRAAAAVEALAGDSAAAEAVLESMLEQLDPEGNAAWFATQTGVRAVALVELDRIGEAITLAEVARAAAPTDDLLAQITWRQAIARAYARVGRPDEAHQIAVDALDLARPTDAPSHLAEALLALAEVRRAARKPGAVDSLVAEALDLLAAKGNLARARQVGGLE
jgi:tetratricopeptide (TPR) repeat protein